MATSRKRNIELDFVVDDKQKSKLRGIGDEATKSGKGFSNMAGSMKLAVVAGAAIVATKIVGYLGDAAKAAAEDEKQQRLLALAMENTVGATEGEIAAVESWIDGMARATGVADDQLRPAMAELVRTTGSTSKAQDTLTVAMDIAAAKGLDLETVTKGIAKAALGNVGALGRMGVKTKDASGEMLTFDEVLGEATKTMGGAASEAAASLSGQMERQQIVWEETKEKIGAQVIPVMAELGGAFSLLIAQMGGPLEGNIANIQNAFNDLVNAGVDPTLEPLRSFVSILADGSVKTDISAESLKVLQDMLGISAGSFGTVSDYISDNSEMLGLNADEVDTLTGLLDTQYQQQRDTDWATRQLTDAQLLNVDATREQIDANRELVDPLFAVIAATERAEDAELKYNEAVEEFGRFSDEAFDAAVDLARSQGDLNAASATYAEEGGPASVDVMQDLLRDAGLSAEEIQRVIDKIKDLNDTPVKRKTFPNPGEGSGSSGRAAGGPVRAGNVYEVGERGRELFVPATNGTIVPNHALGSVSGGGGGDIHIHAGTIVGDGGARQLAVIIRDELVKLGRRNGSTGL